MQKLQYLVLADFDDFRFKVPRLQHGSWFLAESDGRGWPVYAKIALVHSLDFGKAEIEKVRPGYALADQNLFEIVNQISLQPNDDLHQQRLQQENNFWYGNFTAMVRFFLLKSTIPQSLKEEIGALVRTGICNDESVKNYRTLNTLSKKMYSDIARDPIMARILLDEWTVDPFFAPVGGSND